MFFMVVPTILRGRLLHITRLGILGHCIANSRLLHPVRVYYGVLAKTDP